MIVIGCGKAKLSQPAPARELYTGSLFRAARKYAEQRQALTGEPWAILSARHGLVSPEFQLEPYDECLKLKGEALAAWAKEAAAACVRLMRGGPHRVECLAGRAYADPFRAELDEWRVPSCEPLRGRELGMRLRWLSQAVQP